MINPHVEPMGFAIGPDGGIVVEVHQTVRDLVGKLLSEKRGRACPPDQGRPDQALQYPDPISVSVIAQAARRCVAGDSANPKSIRFFVAFHRNS
jgi:hypothetical protein